MKSNHRKHAKLSRPNFGTYGRCEIGLIGAPCGVIKEWVTKVSDALPFSCAYLDADHQTSDLHPYLSITDGINHHRITYTEQLTPFDIKSQSQKSEFLIINGNHFESSSQIVFCTEKKKESLQRKLDRLTDVKMIILEKGISAPFDYLQEVIQRDNPAICRDSDFDDLFKLVLDHGIQARPPIKGLILAGGKSVRMGKDKSHIEYHGIPQWQHLQSLLSDHVTEVKISCRPDQAASFENADLLFDSFEGLGPMGALLSAFRQDPNSAYLMAACDLPLIKEHHLSHLISQVSYSSLATAYHNPETGWPEPMLSIWMPKAYERLLMFLSQGYSCPRKVLINSDVKVINADDSSFLKNANTPEEMVEIKSMISTDE